VLGLQDRRERLVLKYRLVVNELFMNLKLVGNDDKEVVVGKVTKFNMSFTKDAIRR
jgi:hypothetical protein